MSAVQLNVSTGPVYQSPLTDLSLDNFVYQGEQRHFLAIMADPLLQMLIPSARDGVNFKSVNANLTKNALKLDLRFSPKMKYAVERCQSLLKLKTQMQVYVVSSPEMNAFCMPNDGDGIKIGVTSTLLEKFNPAEIAFVMGHEIGHALYNHAAIPTQTILASGAAGLTPLHVMRLLAWKRAAEVTADRIGLLCGDSFEKSARALFKVSYGFDIHEDEALHHYLGEFIDSEKLMKASIAPEDFSATHPFGPVRLVSLDAFAKSSTFASHVGKPSSLIQRDELEARVDRIVSVFESSYLEAPEGLQKDMSDFVFLGGLIVAAADGEIDPEEIETLSIQLNRTIDAAEIREVLAGGPGPAWEKVEVLAKNLAGTVFPRQSMMLVRDLCMVALADGEVMEVEFQTLVRIASFFRLTPIFVADVLKGAVEGLD